MVVVAGFKLLIIEFNIFGSLKNIFPVMVWTFLWAFGWTSVSSLWPCDLCFMLVYVLCSGLIKSWGKDRSPWTKRSETSFCRTETCWRTWACWAASVRWSGRCVERQTFEMSSSLCQQVGSFTAGQKILSPFSSVTLKFSVQSGLYLNLNYLNDHRMTTKWPLDICSCFFSIKVLKQTWSFPLPYSAFQ